MGRHHTFHKPIRNQKQTGAKVGSHCWDGRGLCLLLQFLPSLLMGWGLVTMIHTDPDLGAKGTFTFLSNVQWFYFAGILWSNSDNIDLARVLVDDSGGQLLLCGENLSTFKCVSVDQAQDSSDSSRVANVSWTLWGKSFDHGLVYCYLPQTSLWVRWQEL